MAESMLGANLASMADLVTQFGTTSATITDVSGQSGTIATSVVDEMTQTFTQAVTSIGDTMEMLSQSVREAVAQTDVTEWTGANQQTFLGAAGEFQSACEQIQAEVIAGYEDFSANARAIGENLESFQSTLVANLDNALASTESMSDAVAAQSESLDATMNTGMQLS